MRTFRCRAAVLLASLLASGVAVAETELPDPPFGGGSVPVAKETLTAEMNVLKLLAKYAYKRSYCDTALLDDLILAYTSNAQAKVEAVQAKWVECRDKVEDRYVYERDKALLKGTPACLDAGAIDALRAQIDALRSADNTIAFCDGDNAAPDMVTQLNVPDKVKEGTGEIETARRAAKSYYDALRCLKAVVPRAWREQTVSADSILRMERCVQKIGDKAVVTVDDLEQTQKLPDCLSRDDALSAILLARDTGVDASAGIFCSSPSGAFVDGAPTL